MAEARQIIIDALDEFDVDDFVHRDWNGIAADKVISALEFANYRIVKLRPVARKPFVIEEESA